MSKVSYYPLVFQGGPLDPESSDAERRGYEDGPGFEALESRFLSMFRDDSTDEGFKFTGITYFLEDNETSPYVYRLLSSEEMAVRNATSTEVKASA